MPVTLRRFALLAIVAPLALAAAGRAAADAPADDVVVTSGASSIEVAPDVAFVTVVAESRAKTPGEAQAANARTLTAVQQKLESSGVAKGSLRTRSVDLQPEYDYANGKQTLRGYVARSAIEVRVEPVEKAGAIADTAVAAGASRIEDLRFDLKDRAAAEKQALEGAVRDARARADAVASAAGRSIERILRIEAQSSRPFEGARPKMAMRAEAAAAPPTPVEPGTIEVDAQVTVTSKLRTP